MKGILTAKRTFLLVCLVVSGYLVLMIQQTAGAAIFYTLDGSLPLPRNPMAFLYTAPVTSVPGATLKARAFLSGYLNSEIAMATL